MRQRPGYLRGVATNRPRSFHGFGMPMPMPSLSPMMPGPISIPGPIMPPSLPTPMPMPTPTPTPGPSPAPPTVIYSYPPYQAPSFYQPYPAYGVDSEFGPRPRRRRPEPEVEAKKEDKPKSLLQHLKEWVSGK